VNKWRDPNALGPAYGAALQEELGAPGPIPWSLHGESRTRTAHDITAILFGGSVSETYALTYALPGRPRATLQVGIMFVGARGAVINRLLYTDVMTPAIANGCVMTQAGSIFSRGSGKSVKISGPGDISAALHHRDDVLAGIAGLLRGKANQGGVTVHVDPKAALQPTSDASAPTVFQVLTLPVSAVWGLKPKITFQAKQFVDLAVAVEHIIRGPRP
jgi:hypothetical protein